ncbi:MAG: hypothetical protein QM765_39655 [Myxococcales bacterium]
MKLRGLFPLVAVVLACGTPETDPCHGMGQATEIQISGLGSLLTSRCAWRTGSQPNSFAVGINSKPLGELQITGPLNNGGSCGDGVMVSLQAEDTDGYIIPNWRAGGTDTSDATCTLTSGLAGDRYGGTFTGRLHRIKGAHDAKDEWLDISFNFWVPK